MGPQGQEVTSLVRVRILLIEWTMMPDTAREQHNYLSMNIVILLIGDIRVALTCRLAEHNSTTHSLTL
jgi:hypothetical protein